MEKILPGKILPGKYVEIAYDLFEINPDGKEDLVHTVEPKDAERFIFGVTPGLIPALAHALEGLEQGRTFDVVVPASQGFPYNPDDVATLDRSIFLDDKGAFDSEKIFVGARVPMITGDGYQIAGKVIEITPQHVKMDFNHPLVGKDLRFKGTVEVVRDATEQELHPTCGCGGCGGGSCGDGCGDQDGCCGGCN